MEDLTIERYPFWTPLIFAILDFRQHDIPVIHRTEYGWIVCTVRWHYRLLGQHRKVNAPKFSSIKKVFIQFFSFFRFAKNAPCSGAGDEGGGGELQLVSIVWTHQLASHGTFPRHIPAADHFRYARYLSLVQQCNIVGIRIHIQVLAYRIVLNSVLFVQNDSFTRYWIIFIECSEIFTFFVDAYGFIFKGVRLP